MKRFESCTGGAGLGGCGRVAVACWLLSGMVSTAVWSASAPTSINFDIPAQPLSASLNSVALQANVQMVFEPGSVTGVTAPPVSGSMTIDAALRALLTGTRLSYVRNSDGTVVVRPAVSAQRVSTPRRAVPTAGAAPAPTISKQEFTEGPWTLRAGVVFRDPRNNDDLRLGNSWSTEVGAEYSFSRHVSAELAFGLPNDHSLRQWNAAPGGSLAWIDAISVASQFLTFKYRFLPAGHMRPYLGAGISRTELRDQGSTSVALKRNNFAPVAQAGFDLTLGEHWLFNADLKYSQIRPSVRLSGLPAGKMHADPLFIGFSIGYRFGSYSDAPAAPVPVVPVPQAPPVLTPTQPPPTPPAPPPADSDHDGVKDPDDRCPGTLAGLRVDSEGCEVEAAVLTGVSFETDSAKLTEESAETLDAVVLALLQRSGTKAQIHGYTDDRGLDSYNQQLSERRAAAVAQYLRQHGVAAEVLSSQGHGESQPIAPNSTAEGRAQNRRVTVQFSRAVMK